MRKQNLCIFIFQKLFIIAVTDNTTYCFVKGCLMQNYSAEYILSAADEMNARPRKKLGYATPEELFDSFLYRVYAVDSKRRLTLSRHRLRLAYGILDSASRACCVAVKSGLRRTIFIRAGVQLALAICAFFIVFAPRPYYIIFKLTVTQ